MSAQQNPLTYEGILEMFREEREQLREMREQFRETREQMKDSERKLDRMFQETDRKMKETAEQMKETDRIVKQTSKDIAALGSRIGEIIENMVKGDIVSKFQVFGYEIDDYCEKKKFKNKDLGIRGEIDLFLENGDIAILIEVKTTLETKDVHKHIERLTKFRRYIDTKGIDQRHFIGAVAGAVIEGEAEEVAHENGMYVIVQSGKAVDIINPPEGFEVRRW